jgi:hypothetical protein
VSLVSDKLNDLVKVADLVGHSNTRTTEGYRHAVRPTLPHAVNAWNELLPHKTKKASKMSKAGRARRPELKKAS